MRNVKMLMALVAVVGLVSTASAYTINYQVLVNGLDLAVVTPAEVTPGQITVAVLANCPDADFGGGMYGGVLQYSVDLAESAAALEPDQGPGPPPLFPPNGMWDSASVAPLTNYAGPVNVGGMEVLGQTGAIAPSAFDVNFATFGAGPGVYSEVGSGTFVWDGGATILDLLPGELTAMLVYGVVAGPESPTAAFGDSVEFIPEPATMSLLVLGALGLIRRKK